MKPSRIRTGLLTLLTTALLCLGGTAQAQLQIFGKTTNLSGLSPAALTHLYNQIQIRRIYQVKISGTISTLPTVGDGGISSVFGLNGPAVPVVAYAFVDTAQYGPTVSLAQGTVVDGNTLLDKFVGYKGAQILAIYIRVGTEAGPKKEVGYLNYPGLAPSLPASSVSSIDIGGSNAANVWLNRDLYTSVPNDGFFTVESASGPSFLMQIGGAIYGGSALAISPSIYVQDVGSYAFGSVTSVEVTNVSAGILNYIRNKARAEADYNRSIADLRRHKREANAARIVVNVLPRAANEGSTKWRWERAKRAYDKALAEQRKAQTTYNRARATRARLLKPF